MKAMIKRFVHKESGAAGVGYAPLLAFVALVVVASGPIVKAVVGSIWGTIATQLSTIAA